MIREESLWPHHFPKSQTLDTTTLDFTLQHIHFGDINKQTLVVINNRYLQAFCPEKYKHYRIALKMTLTETWDRTGWDRRDWELGDAWALLSFASLIYFSFLTVKRNVFGPITPFNTWKLTIRYYSQSINAWAVLKQFIGSKFCCYCMFISLCLLFSEQDLAIVFLHRLSFPKILFWSSTRNHHQPLPWLRSESMTKVNSGRFYFTRIWSWETYSKERNLTWWQDSR